SFSNGSRPSSYTSLKVGAIMKKVKNNAKPMSTWFGGICCVASDVRTNDKTTTIRVKLVIKINIPGAIDKIVRSNIKRTDVDNAAGSVSENMLIKSDMLIIIFLCNILFNDFTASFFYIF